ncbi:hypothetical protein WICMUC_004553 [Wickerhamomyces mucosus]|uniref:Uncharacterized protein n=1 Tax=Wickerhamomyces mucosus TaxID=1378264 RepID=A0A9P8TAX8_9ASCO|nr:hypothetical protein WICMUC_004553 [Wickerhamomyces mucosus]
MKSNLYDFITILSLFLRFSWQFEFKSHAPFPNLYCGIVTDSFEIEPIFSELGDYELVTSAVVFQPSALYPGGPVSVIGPPIGDSRFFFNFTEGLGQRWGYNYTNDTILQRYVIETIDMDTDPRIDIYHQMNTTVEYHVSKQGYYCVEFHNDVRINNETLFNYLTEHPEYFEQVKINSMKKIISSEKVIFQSKDLKFEAMEFLKIRSLILVPFSFLFLFWDLIGLFSNEALKNYPSNFLVASPFLYLFLILDSLIPLFSELSGYAEVFTVFASWFSILLTIYSILSPDIVEDVFAENFPLLFHPVFILPFLSVYAFFVELVKISTDTSSIGLFMSSESDFSIVVSHMVLLYLLLSIGILISIFIIFGNKGSKETFFGIYLLIVLFITVTLYSIGIINSKFSFSNIESLDEYMYTKSLKCFILAPCVFWFGIYYGVFIIWFPKLDELFSNLAIL